MSQAAKNLIEELYRNVSASGNQVLERRLADLAVWHYNNVQTLSRDNLAGRQDFLEKSFWILLEVCALQTERIHELERKQSSRHLWTPAGMSVDGDLRDFK